MSKQAILVAGFGPGLSKAVAQRFGKEGFRVALVARNAERLAEGVKELGALGVEARAFTADLSDPARIADAFWALHSARAEHSIAVG